MKRDLYTFFVGSVAFGLVVLFLADSAFADADKSNITDKFNITDLDVNSSNGTDKNTTTTLTPNTTSSAPTTPTTTHNASTLSPNTTLPPTTVPSSTTSPSRTTSHVLTTSSTAATPTTPPQHFDAASFIGGIILCAGVIAIVFFGCKFYKARTSPTFARY